MNTSDDITIRFPLTDGEGSNLENCIFSNAERMDLRSSVQLCISREEWVADEKNPARIISIEILYDGISRISDRRFGYYFVEDKIQGYPAPIIRFTLNNPVDVDTFVREMSNTSIRVLTNSMIENEIEPFYAEDHSGYITSLTRDEIIELEKDVEFYQLKCGKVFRFDATLLPEVLVLDGVDFMPERISNKPR